MQPYIIINNRGGVKLHHYPKLFLNYDHIILHF